MSHIDTLKVYEEYRAAGFNDAQSKHLTNILENSFMTKTTEWMKELKEDFASQKMVSILGGLILLAMTAGISLMWHISLELSVLKTCGIQRIENK